MSKPLGVIRGDTKIYTLTYTDSDGEPLDLTGYTVWFTVKENVDDTDASAKIQKEITSHTDPTNGITTVTLDPADTDDLAGSYHYDIQLVDSDGNPMSTRKSTFTVWKDVTRNA